MFFCSTIDRKPLTEVNSYLENAVTKLQEAGSEMVPSRRLGIRELPMPPVPFDADDDVDEDENDGVAEQDLWKKEEDLYESIVKSFAKSKQSSTSPTEICKQLQEQYVLMKLLCDGIFVVTIPSSRMMLKHSITLKHYHLVIWLSL